MTEIPKKPEIAETQVDLMEFGRDLSYEIEAARQRLEALSAQYAELPPDVLADLAWKGIAWYHGADGAVARMTGGASGAANLRMGRIKDQRLAALPDDQAREVAIRRANAWLDDHFDE